MPAISYLWGKAMNLCDKDESRALAVLKAKALTAVNEISTADYTQYYKRLGNNETAALAISEIDALEQRTVNSFCDNYIKKIVEIFDANPQYQNRLTRNVIRKYRYIGRFINDNEADTIFIKNDSDLTVERAKNILKQSDSKNIRIVIADTSAISLDALEILNSPKIYFQHRGNHIMTLPRIINTFTTSELTSTIHEIHRLEKGINPEWSDTARALYLARQMAENYSADYSQKSIKGLFIGKIGDCEAFSACFEELMMRQNIPCHICGADDGGHVFNEIMVGGKWVPVDVTWMSGCKSKEELTKRENVEFAGEKFVKMHGEHGYYHQDSMAKFMHKDGTINFLSADELEKARKEIAENPKNHTLTEKSLKNGGMEI